MITHFLLAEGTYAVWPKCKQRHVNAIALKEYLMKYIVSWSLPQGTYNAAATRFVETGGAPPKGVQLLGRWHGMSGQGFAVAESVDAKALYLWQAQWADVLPITMTPCLEDADAGEVLSSLAKR